MKTCSMCHQDKALTKFHRDRSRSDGRQRICKKCKTVEAGMRRRADLRGYAERQRAWRARNPEAVRQIAGRYSPDPVKEAARRAVHEAIRLGRLTRPSVCEACQAPGPTHAHHHDYSLPLDVAFLCPTCHLLVHGKQPRTIDPAVAQ